MLESLISCKSHTFKEFWNRWRIGRETYRVCFFLFFHGHLCVGGLTGVTQGVRS